jgi:hypothetical protein
LLLTPPTRGQRRFVLGLIQRNKRRLISHIVIAFQLGQNLKGMVRQWYPVEKKASGSQRSILAGLQKFDPPHGRIRE